MGTEADLEVQGSENPAYGLGTMVDIWWCYSSLGHTL